ncbi:MAG: segregation and condensation protein A [Bdellovibrionota bacterium]
MLENSNNKQNQNSLASKELPFEISLDCFSGPIDLLLHLVKKNELEIEKLSLAQVANQYLECLEAMKRIDLEIAGEYLVMATTLLSIKASVMLSEPVELELNEDGDLVDPSEELLRRLREAEIYKQGAKELSKAKILGIDVFARPSSLKEFEEVRASLSNEDTTLLAIAFGKAIKNLKNKGEYVISVDNVSIVDRMMSVLYKIKERGGNINFSDLVSDAETVVDVVGYFCAILELCRRHIVKVYQKEAYEDIMLGLEKIDFDEEKFKKAYIAESHLEEAV